MEDKNVTLELTAVEANDILRVLGELPSKSGAFPLMVKISNQIQAQVPAEPAAE